ncbi:MAG: hypothetical protein LBV12_10570, partial [Puniceicoccales bacterium]|nr:hypothetical protein [Puniceicoccales bacterium]
MTELQAVVFAARDGDWVGNIIQIIVVALFLGGPFLIKLFKSAQDSQPKPQPQQNDSAEDNERIRRIREEVARRAAQQRGNQNPRPAAPPPVPTQSRTQRTAPPPLMPRVEPVQEPVVA